MIPTIIAAELIVVVAFIVTRLGALWKVWASLQWAQRWTVVAFVVQFVGTALWAERADTMSVAVLEGGEWFQIGCMALSGAILLAVVAVGGSRRAAWNSGAAWLLVYSLMCLISAIDSPAPLLSAYKAGLLLLDLLFVIVGTGAFAAGPARTIFLRVIYAVFTFVCIGAALGVVLYPDTALKPIGGMIGVQLYGTIPYTNADELGFISAIVAVLAYAGACRPGSLLARLTAVSIGVLSLTILVFCQARTSIIGFAVAFLIVAWLTKGQRLVLGGALLICAGYVAYTLIDGQALLVDEVVAEYLGRGLSEEQIRSLTGRTDLWKSGFAMFLDSPIIGHGFEAGARTGGESYGIQAGMHMHSSHVQILVNTGILGYLPWLAMVTQIGLRLTRGLFAVRLPAADLDDRVLVALSAAYVVCLVRTITGSVLLSHSYSMMLLVSIMVFLGGRAMNRAAQPVKPTVTGLQLPPAAKKIV
jgi:O-antigen ligase